jgi:sensor c-di-GMP phosphodiesterase-like protein
VTCVSHEGVIPGNPQLVIRNGSAWNQSVIHWTTDPLASFYNLRLTVAATKEYVDRFKREGRLLAAVIAAVLALPASFLVYVLLVRRMSVANLIQQGLRRHEFVPHYQPIVDAASGSVLGAEALARWRRDGRLIPASQFVEYAEERGLIEPITDQLILKVLADLRRLGWVGTDHYISINVTPDLIMKSAFCEGLMRLLAANGIPARNLAIEITERHRLSDLQEGRRRLSCLAGAGIDIKIDDAGTGFGGFSYVQELPVSTLKIDKMFVDTLRAPGDAKRPVLDAIIHFGRVSGLAMIAEGVETQEQVAYLMKSGVRAIQGYVYARPMPVDQLIRWMEARGDQEVAGVAKSFSAEKAAGTIQR